jgi:hypothetical protein
LPDVVHGYLVAILQMTSTFITNTGTFVSTIMLSINLRSTDEDPCDSVAVALVIDF